MKEIAIVLLLAIFLVALSEGMGMYILGIKPDPDIGSCIVPADLEHLCN